MEDSVQSLPEVKVNNIHCSPCIHPVTSRQKAIGLVKHKLPFAFLFFC